MRLGGIAAPDPSADPFVGFSAIRPLYQVKNGIASTAPERLSYFNEASFPVVKPPNTMRIFTFGGSTTYGRPFDGRTSFSRWLQDLLAATDPDKKFEVINAGGISYASYRIVPLVKECLQYEPDLIIVYTGHNEFLERRTYSGLFRQGGTLVAVRSVVEKLRVYQALKRLAERIVPGLSSGSTRGTGTKTNSPCPDKTVLKDEVNAILDRSAGLDLYHRDEEFTRGVVEHFAHNLRAMVALCRQAGVPVFFVIPGENLKDFSPFKSEHTNSLSSRQRTDLDRQLNSAISLVGEGRDDEALGILQNVERQDPLYARTYFWEAKALLAKGMNEQAKTDFVRAKDLDVCPLRCISPIEDEIIKIAHAQKVPLIPFKAALERLASESGDRSGIPGNESFLDHVHPTIERHQLLAQQIVKQMVAQGLVSEKRHLTDKDRQALYQAGMKTLDRKFFATKDLNLAKVLRWAGKKQEARKVLKRAAGVLDGNPEVHKMMGGFLLEDGKYRQAVEEYVKAVELSGNDPRMEFSLATAYYKAGMKSDALRLYEKLFKNNPGSADVCADLGTILLEKGDLRHALTTLRSGLAVNRDSAGLFGPYALALAMTGKPDKAIPWMLRAVKAEPGNPKLLYNLAGMYALTGKQADALAALNHAVDKGYSRRDSLSTDPVFDSIRQLPEFQRILDRIR